MQYLTQQTNMEENTQEKDQKQDQPVVSEIVENKPDQDDVEKNKLWALVGYLGILCLITLLGKKDSKFAQFHAKQGLVLALASLLAWFPLFGWILGVVVFVFMIMGILNVLSGKMEKLPIVGDLAEKINI